MKTCRLCFAETTEFYSGRTECKECTKQKSKETRQRKGSEAIKQYNKDYWEANKETLKAKNKERYESNREEYKANMREYYKENKHAFLSYNSARRAKTKQATPAWYDAEEVNYIYKLAQERGLEVDHIVPLNHPLVCGLHVQNNLRCIPKKLNLWKSNKLLDGVRNGL